MMRLVPLFVFVLLLALVGCEIETAIVRPAAVTDDAHPVAIASDATCRSCHVDNGAAQPPPIWHVLDCCGPSWGDCGDCHREGVFQPPKFDHDETDFPLVGRHRRDPEEQGDDGPVRCDRCHAPERPAPHACDACHLESKPVSHGWIETACGRCHSPDAFPGATFDHLETGWLLEAPHRDRNCSACHVRDAVDAPRRIDGRCACCHTHDARSAPVEHRFPLVWRAAQPRESASERTVCFDDTPVEGADARDCDICHGLDAFEPVAYDHSTWPLVGAHLEPRVVGGRTLAKCDRCHLDRNEGRLPETCIGCHTPDGRADGWPTSHQFGWPTADGCTPCHAADRGWLTPDLGHDPLLPGHGADEGMGCDACHLGRRSDASRGLHGCGDVGACHADDYGLARVRPDHPVPPDPGNPENCAASGCHPVRASGTWVP